MALSDSKTRELEALYAAQASSWVETMRDAGPGEEMRFVAWLKESPRNVRDFLLMQSLDCALEKLDAERLHSIEALIRKVDQRVTPLTLRPAPAAAAAARSRRLRRTALGRRRARRGGGRAFLVCASRVSDDQLRRRTGEQRTFELEDGSVVSLNTHSRVAVQALAAHARKNEVRLLRGGGRCLTWLTIRAVRSSSRPTMPWFRPWARSSILYRRR